MSEFTSRIKHLSGFLKRKKKREREGGREREREREREGGREGERKKMYINSKFNYN